VSSAGFTVSVEEGVHTMRIPPEELGWLYVLKDREEYKSLARCRQRQDEGKAVLFDLTETYDPGSDSIWATVKSPSAYGLFYKGAKTDNQILDLVRSWLDGIDARGREVAFCYDGVNLEKPALHWLLHEIAYDLCFFYLAVNAAIAKEFPRRVIFVGDRSLRTGLLCDMCNARGIDLRLVRPPVRVRARDIGSDVYERLLKPFGRILRDVLVSAGSRFRPHRLRAISPPDPREIIVIADFLGGNRYEKAFPAVAALPNRERYRVVYIGLNATTGIASKNGARVDAAYRWTTFGSLSGAARSVSATLRAWKGWSVAYSGTTRSQASRILDQVLVSRFWGRLYTFYMTAERVGSAIRREAPDLFVLVGHDVEWAGKVLARVAERADIPSLYLQHCILVGGNTLGDLDYTKIAVSGPYYKTVFAQSRNDSERIEVTGPPFLDGYLGLRERRREPGRGKSCPLN